MYKQRLELNKEQLVSVLLMWKMSTVITFHNTTRLLTVLS